MKLHAEATSWPNGRSDDLLMALHQIKAEPKSLRYMVPRGPIVTRWRKLSRIRPGAQWSGDGPGNGWQ